jgi:hypothetical protein
MCPSGATCLPADLFQWTSTIKIQLSMLVLNKADLIIISLKINLFSPWYSWKIAELVFTTITHSLQSTTDYSWIEVPSLLKCVFFLFFFLYKVVQLILQMCVYTRVCHTHKVNSGMMAVTKYVYVRVVWLVTSDVDRDVVPIPSLMNVQWYQILKIQSVVK